MNQIERNLLLRVARRLEERAEDAWAAASAKQMDAKAHETAKRQRDRDYGDARDLRAFAVRQPIEPSTP